LATIGYRNLAIDIEADLIRLRTREGMKIEKARGRLRGKQPKLNPRQEAHLVALRRAGNHTTSELADLFGVAPRSIGRSSVREQHETEQEARSPTTPASLGVRYFPPNGW
jgi:DNA invertase Pin-like site-specific DNA recombinase